MRKKGVIAGIILATFVVAMFLLIRPEREPTVAGRPIHHWMAELQNSSFDRTVIAGEHLATAGTDAVEYLARSLDSNTTRRKVAKLYQTIWTAMPEFLKRRLPFPGTPDFDRRNVIDVLGRLAPNHPEAVGPLLVELGNPEAEVRFAVVTALAKADPERSPNAFPALINTLTNDPAANVRARAAYGLADMGTPASAAVPALLTSLTNQHPEVRWTSTKALGNLAKDDTNVINALETRLQDTNAVVRAYAALSLFKVTGSAEPSTALLISMIRDAGNPDRRAAASVIGLIGPAARDAIPTLSWTAEDADEGLRLFSARALWEIDGETNRSLTVLREILKGGTRYHQIRAVEFLEKMGPAALPALSELTRAATQPDLLVRRGAIRALGAIGPEAASALPALENALNDPAPSVRAAARTSIQTIRAYSENAR